MLQRTTEWLHARCGKVTASRIGDLMATIKSGEAAGRSQYRAEKVLERESGIPQDGSYVNDAMQFGIDNESAARQAYEFARSVDVVEVGFVPHPKIDNAGASPDGLVGDDGLVEIKCPKARGMVDARLGKDPDLKYVLQCQFQMACTGRKWVDLATYRPGCRLSVRRIERDNELIRKIETEVLKFLNEVEREYQELLAAR